MKKILPGLVRFFVTEKLYSILLLVFLLVVGVALLSAPKNHEAQDPGVRALKTYQEAEQKFQKKVDDAGSMEKYIQDHPEAGRMFYGIMAMFCLLVFSGLALDAFLLFRPEFRRTFQRAEYRSPVTWPPGTILKVVILILFSGLVLSLLTGVADRIFRVQDATNFYLLLHATLVDGLCVYFVWHFVRKNGGGWRDLGLAVPDGGFIKELAVGLGAYLAVIPLFIATLIVALAVAQLIRYEPPAHPLVGVFLEEEKRSPVLVVYSVVLATAIGPFLEEIFFRGFCYPILKKRFGMGAAMVTTAAFFAFIHENSFAFWPIFVLGLALVWVYEKRKSLVAPIVLHITHNTLFIGYFFLAKKFILQGGGM
jgi:membrane protease YdiL (CAAX protease family)